MSDEYDWERTDKEMLLAHGASRVPLPLFGSWLASTRKLQREGFGVDPHDLEGDEFQKFVVDNVTAIVSELGEFLAEWPGWKYWVRESARGRPGSEARARAIGELVDVLHFAANLLVLLRVTDGDLCQRYNRKSRVNADRQAAGYDGSAKCPTCGRADDDE